MLSVPTAVTGAVLILLLFLIDGFIHYWICFTSNWSAYAFFITDKGELKRYGLSIDATLTRRKLKCIDITQRQCVNGLGSCLFGAGLIPAKCGAAAANLLTNEESGRCVEWP